MQPGMGQHAMDKRTLEATRNHYNHYSNQVIDRRQALQKREEAVSLPLRKFHNTIKRSLINRFAYGTDRLLDLACGRGGDIQKWIDAQIKYVKGVDLSSGEIKEARHRFDNALRDRPAFITRAEFEDTDQLGISPYNEPEPFDVVTCMFAVHYFFVSETAVKNFMRNVSANLKDRGYFVGTCPDGKQILALLNQTSKWETDVCTIHARWQGKYSCFGSSYSMAIKDTVTEGHEFGGRKGKGSYEYLVFRNVLEGVAARFDLYPVKDYGDPSMDNLFVEEARGQLFKHFNPKYSSENLVKASGVNVAFCFQKIAGGRGAAVTLPPLPRTRSHDSGGQGHKTGGKRRDDGEASQNRNSRPRYG